MMFCTKADAPPAKTTDSGKIRLGGACRLPLTVVDRGEVRTGDVRRLPANTTDSGKIRLGGACRLPLG
jgi:hypothetical protein